MDDKLQKQLFKKYPKLLKQEEIPTHPFSDYGIEFWDGWYDIFDTLCTAIQNYIDSNSEDKFPQPTILQAKQKFSKMRIYCSNTDRYIDGLINMAEFLSYKVCEKCGTNQNVSTNSKGYMLTLCGNCRKQMIERNKI